MSNTYSAKPVLERIDRDGLPTAIIAERLGVDERSIQRWRKGGGLRKKDTDKVATALGLHIDILWPEMRRL